MQKIKMTSSILNKLTANFKDKLVGNRITNLTVVNSRDYVLSFSIYKKEKLLISLNHQDPFISFLSLDDVPVTTVGQLNDTLRKELKDGYIVSIETINNDKILKIKTQKSNDYFEKITRVLVLEFIPFRPNLIILDENDVILYAAHTTDISNAHPIIKGIKYESPKPIAFIDEEFDEDNYKKLAKEYWLSSKENRLKERFDPLFQHIRIRIKSLNKKLIVLNNDIKKAEERLNNEEIGNMLIAYSYDLESLRQYVIENKIDYDDSLSPGVNASFYFKKYKKAKRSIECDKQEINKTQEELSYFEHLNKVSEFMNEEELISLAEELIPTKFHNKIRRKPSSQISFVEIENHKIIFGKNAKKNEEVTFKLANKTDLFMHIKDYHGSHVIIKGDNPSNNVLLTAAEICLLLSNTSLGEIQYTQVKNVKKGDVHGKVNLLSYNTYNLTNVRNETKELIINAKNI